MCLVEIVIEPVNVIYIHVIHEKCNDAFIEKEDIGYTT